MEFLFTAKFKVAFIIILSVVGFAYFKYVKHTCLPSKYGFIIGIIFLAIGWASTGSFFSLQTLLESMLLRSDIPYMLEKTIMIGYFFMLVGLMSLVDEILCKAFNKKDKNA
jgi:hypothetical protein